MHFYSKLCVFGVAVSNFLILMHKNVECTNQGMVSPNYTTGNDESCKVFNMSKLTKQWNKHRKNNIENTYIYLRYNDISSNTRKT